MGKGRSSVAVLGLNAEHLAEHGSPVTVEVAPIDMIEVSAVGRADDEWAGLLPPHGDPDAN